MAQAAAVSVNSGDMHNQMQVSHSQKLPQANVIQKGTSQAVDRNQMGQPAHLDGESKMHEMIDANRRIEQLINPSGNGSAT